MGRFTPDIDRDALPREWRPKHMAVRAASGDYICPRCGTLGDLTAASRHAVEKQEAVA